MQITVVGHAHASLPPERATLHVRLGVEGGDKQAAVRETTQLVLDFVDAVAQLKAMTPSPTTWSAVASISTRSWRPWSNDAPLPIRHAAECPVQLKFRDFRALSRFIDEWGGRAGVSVERVEWSLTEARRTAEEERVLSAAVQQAHARATTMARAAGEQDVRFVEIADQGLLDDRAGDGTAFAAAMRSAPAAAGEGITLAPEDVRLDVTLHARFTTD